MKKAALVTGASRGISRGIAIELAKAGYRLAINYAANVDAAVEALQLVRNAGGEGFTIQADMPAEPIANGSLPILPPDSAASISS